LQIRTLAFATLAVGSIVVARTSVDSAAQGTAPAAYTETIPNTKITFDMVPIPAGTFTMGSPDSEAGRAPTRGRNTRSLPAFYMAAKEITWSEYDEFAFSLDLQRKRKLGLTGPKDGAMRSRGQRRRTLTSRGAGAKSRSR
jgi:formylglycine-generating enzyme required for sulfatase activity